MEGLEQTHIRVGEQELTVAVADRPETRQRGLMGVEELPRGLDGMLFVFDSPSSAFFHMLRTPLELDIWWFDPSGEVIGSTRMQPCPEEPCPFYASPAPIGWALEVPAGAFDFRPGELLSAGE